MTISSSVTSVGSGRPQRLVPTESPTDTILHAGAVGDLRYLEVPRDDADDLATVALHLMQAFEGDLIHLQNN
jgi:hypothetical protein